MKNRSLLPFLSLVFLLLGLPPLNLWPLAWISFVPLLMMVGADPLKQKVPGTAGAWHPLVVGLIYYGYGLAGFATYELSIYLLAWFSATSAFWLYFFLLKLILKRSHLPLLKGLAPPVLWYVLQSLYVYSPIGTIATEVPFYGPLAFMQITPYFGFQAHGALVVGLCAGIANVLVNRNRWCQAPSVPGTIRNPRPPAPGPLRAFRLVEPEAWTLAPRCMLLFFLSLLTLSFFWGRHQLSKPLTPPGQTKVALIQHNLPPSLEWRIENKELVFETYRRLTEEAFQKGAQFLIFPLYDVGLDLYREPALLAKLTGGVKVPVLLTTYIRTEAQSLETDFWDMALLFSPDGALVDDYQALDPPPFRKIGEKKGVRLKVLNSPLGRLGMMLCYENGLQPHAKKLKRLGADLFISQSNPGFFNRTLIPHYHLMQDALRALETRSWVLRVTPNGFTAVMDPRGRVVEKIGLDRAGILYTDAGG